MTRLSHPRPAAETSRRAAPAWLGREEAAATLEMALLLPFLVFVFATTVDFGRVFSCSIAVASAARNGATYAADTRVYDKTRYQSVTEAALAEAPDLKPAPTVSVVDPQWVGDVECVAVTVSYPFTPTIFLPGLKNQIVVRRTVVMPKAPRQVDGK